MSWRLTNAQQASGSEDRTRDEGQGTSECKREMKSMKGRIPIAIAGLLVVAAVAAAASLSSASSAASSTEGLQLDGTWMVTVTRVNPPPGVAPTFKSLLIYTRGGGMIETSNTGTTRRGAALGQWERIGNNLFATSMWLFRFDPATGPPWVRKRSTRRCGSPRTASRSRQSLSSTSSTSRATGLEDAAPPIGWQRGREHSPPCQGPPVSPLCAARFLQHFDVTELRRLPQRP
jgi:hypothetical protein